MPSSPSAIQNDAYAQLIEALHHSPSALLEIVILPSSFPPQILHDSTAVGVPKSLLVSLYPKARSTFFDHVSSPDPESYHAALQATAIILLFDPNHLTAANFRKRHIQRFSCERAKQDDGDRDAEDRAAAVRHELKFLESLVTSPLSKHAKSSTLWAQRLWIVQNFLPSAMRERATVEASRTIDVERGMRQLWDEELVIVMKAGERHPRNYYAWQYARQLFSFVPCERSDFVERRPWDGKLLRDSIGLVHGWCLRHPRDISGWAFLVFLLEQLRNEGCDKAAQRQELEDDIGIIASETREFARKYKWKGESIEWFIKATKTLNTND